ncbi:MAG: ROK family transcriptional regulator [Firmicutes bacterium]|nr:ROK family transcriptional regulator [Bacillota bacterium]
MTNDKKAGLRVKKAINQELMRNTNKTQILKCIKERQPVSKREIAEELGLSTTTIATFIKELQRERMIRSGGTGQSTGGRRSVLYQLNPDYSYALGIDLKVDRMIGVLLNFKGDIKGAKAVDLIEQDEWQVSRLLRDFIEELLAENKVTLQQVGGIWIGVPGVLNRERTIIEFAPNLGWRNVNLPAMLAFEQPIYLENEANAGALGEVVFGAAQQVSHLVYVSVGVGIGCGLIINHKLFPGFLQQAGEFGHMTVEPLGERCRCGNQGCWEVYASNAAALRLYAEKTKRHQVTFPEFLRQIGQGEQPALEVLQSLLRYLGLGIANLINGLNPEMVVVGGELTAVKELVYPTLLREIKARALAMSFAGVRLEFSQLGEQAVALGMGSIVLDQMLNTVN